MGMRGVQDDFVRIERRRSGDERSNLVAQRVHYDNQVAAHPHHVLTIGFERQHGGCQRVGDSLGNPHVHLPGDRNRPRWRNILLRPTDIVGRGEPQLRGGQQKQPGKTTPAGNSPERTREKSRRNCPREDQSHWAHKNRKLEG